jgi:hypothetical protein
MTSPNNEDEDQRKRRKRKPRPRFVSITGKALPKPRGLNAGKVVDTTREIINVPISQRLGLRIEEYAALTGQSRATVDRQIKNGKIEVVEQGSVRIIPHRFLVKVGWIE